jgi:hypothetical protein
MPDWFNNTKPISAEELERWSAVHHPKKDSGTEADTIRDKLNPDGTKREDSPEHMISGGL